MGWSGDLRNDVESILCAKCLIYRGIDCPRVSRVIPRKVHGVQGVASSNPATPTIVLEGQQVRVC
jgi:hypothetical protein